MHLRINISLRETKNYHGKIYIRKLLTYLIPVVYSFFSIKKTWPAHFPITLKYFLIFLYIFYIF